MIEKLNSYLLFANKRVTFKLKASSIVETLVASIIMVIIFSIASLTLNNVFKSIIKKDISQIENHLNKLNYLQQNNKVAIPYFEEFNGWKISIQKANNDTYYNLNILAEKELKQIRKTVLNVEY